MNISKNDNSEISDAESNDTETIVPVTNAFQLAIKNALRLGAASQQIKDIMNRLVKRQKQKRFE